MDNNITKSAIIGLSFASVLAGLLLLDSRGWSQTPSRTSLIKPATDVVVGVKSLPDPLIPFAALVRPELHERAVMKETEGCKTLKLWEPVYVTSVHLRSVYEVARPTVSEVGVLAIAGDTNCVRVGHPAHLAELDGATGASSTLGYFMPTAISGRRANFANIENLILISAGLFGKDVPVVFVTGRLINVAESSPPLYFAPRMIGVRMLERAEVESAIADGTQIVDVRSKQQFDLVRIKGAIHVPYTMGPRARRLDPYSSYAKSGDAFDIRRINPDRQKTVVLIGENNESEEPIRAAIVLRSEGWKNIFIFQEGMSYFAGMLSRPPHKSVLVGFVEGVGQIQSVRMDAALGAKFVDVRSTREFNQGTIAGSFNAPYVERDDLRLRRLGLNGSILSNYGDTWASPENLAKTTPLIFFGENERDWRPYKAALMARAAGFNSVYIFPSGFSAWRWGLLSEPALFPTTVRGGQ